MVYISENMTIARVKNLYLYCRNSIITPWYIGRRVKVHCGNKFIPLHISKGMVGSKLGQFVMTKRMGAHIHKKKKKKGRNMGKKKGR
jgi:small subunit ribosomal protein S19